MKRSGWRLAFWAILFLVWIAYLGFLAATTAQPTVLSRPQFLSADLYVVAYLDGTRFWPDLAELAVAPVGCAAVEAGSALKLQAEDSPGDFANIREVIWAAQPEDRKLQRIYLANLNECSADYGWKGRGDYILALSHSAYGDKVFEVTARPKTPGFLYYHLPGLIYKVTPQTRRQLDTITKEYHP